MKIEKLENNDLEKDKKYILFLLKNELIAKKLELEEKSRKNICLTSLITSFILSNSVDKKLLYLNIISLVVSNIEVIKYGINIKKQYDLKISIEKIKQKNYYLYLKILDEINFSNEYLLSVKIENEVNKIKLSIFLLAYIFSCSYINEFNLSNIDTLVFNGILSGIMIDSGIDYVIKTNSLYDSYKFLKKKID